MPHRSIIRSCLGRALEPLYDAAPDLDAGDTPELRRMRPIFRGFRYGDR
jgi:hypothetical protein